jgi:Ala-tRNA(Pro) deacylase
MTKHLGASIMHGIPAYLRLNHIHFETLLHRPSATASQRAENLHVPGGQLAKAVLALVGGRFLLTILPATHWIRLERIAALCQTPDVRLANEEELERVFHDCERGAVPIFGRLYGLKSMMDASLGGNSSIVTYSNRRHESLRLKLKDFENLERPTRARFAEHRHPRRDRRIAG